MYRHASPYQLPYLFKVLSIHKVLSIQAHPDIPLARHLHATRPHLYKDANHKPEMAVAVTRFEAMCGFRDARQIAAYLESEKGMLRTCAPVDGHDVRWTTCYHIHDMMQNMHMWMTCH